MTATDDQEPEFYLTERGEAPQTPDFDGRGPRSCFIADTFVSSSGREYWRVNVEPDLSANGREWSQVVLVNRHRGVSVRDVFSGDVVRVHVALIADWQGLTDRDATGIGASDYWGEIVGDTEAIPDVILFD